MKMAEAEETAAPAIDDTDVEETPGYKPPTQKSMAEMLNQDTEDESLRKYKASLLGSVSATETTFWPDDPRRVIVKSIALVVEGREDVVLDLTGDLEKLKSKSFCIKEGSNYRLRVNFCVQREIVVGLRLVIKLSRKMIKVDSASHMMGSYGPKEEEQSFTTPVDEAPKGMVARGTYKMSCEFRDDDKNSYLQWSFNIDIKKEWD
jgi:hypothetical protein